LRHIPTACRALTSHQQVHTRGRRRRQLQRRDATLVQCLTGQPSTAGEVQAVVMGGWGGRGGEGGSRVRAGTASGQRRQCE
jgi:hypothetical protein